MKRIVILLAMCSLFVGCTESHRTEISVESVSESVSSGPEKAFKPVDFDSLIADSGRYAAQTNEIVYYTEAEVEEILRSCAYFDIADSRSCSVPKSVSYVSSFTLSYVPRQENAFFIVIF